MEGLEIPLKPSKRTFIENELESEGELVVEKEEDIDDIYYQLSAGNTINEISLSDSVKLLHNLLNDIITLQQDQVKFEKFRNVLLQRYGVVFGDLAGDLDLEEGNERVTGESKLKNFPTSSTEELRDQVDQESSQIKSVEAFQTPPLENSLDDLGVIGKKNFENHRYLNRAERVQESSDHERVVERVFNDNVNHGENTQNQESESGSEIDQQAISSDAKGGLINNFNESSFDSQTSLGEKLQSSKVEPVDLTTADRSPKDLSGGKLVASTELLEENAPGILPQFLSSFSQKKIPKRERESDSVTNRYNYNMKEFENAIEDDSFDDELEKIRKRVHSSLLNNFQDLNGSNVLLDRVSGQVKINMDDEINEDDENTDKDKEHDQEFIPIQDLISSTDLSTRASISDVSTANIRENILKRRSKSQTNLLLKLFNLVNIPNLSIEDFLLRLQTYSSSISSTGYIHSALMIFKLTILYNLVPLTLRNVYRFILASIRCSTKTLEDIFQKQKTFATVGGVSLKDLFKIEVGFLYLMDFKLELSESILNDFLLNGIAPLRTFMTKNFEQKV